MACMSSKGKGCAGASCSQPGSARHDAARLADSGPSWNLLQNFEPSGLKLEPAKPFVSSLCRAPALRCSVTKDSEHWFELHPTCMSGDSGP